METDGKLAQPRLCRHCLRHLHKDFSKEAVDSAFLESKVELNATQRIGDWLEEVCPNCMGLNQLANDPRFVNYVVQSAANSGFEFDCFNVNFRLPLSLKLRQRYCFQKLGGTDAKDSPLADFDVKMTVKNVLNSELAARLSKKVSPTEDFVISLELTNNEDEREFVSSQVRTVRGGAEP